MFKSCSLDSLYIVRIILTCGTVKFKSHAMFSQTYNSFFRKQNVAFPAGGIMIITSPTVSFLSVFLVIMASSVALFFLYQFYSLPYKHVRF